MLALLASLPLAVLPHPQADDPWVLQASLEDGPERNAALVAALAPEAFDALTPRARQDRLEVAFQAFLDAGERFAAQEMLDLAHAMYTRSPGVWSAFCIEGAQRRGFGRYDEADAVLAERIEFDGEWLGQAGRVELMERRAIVAAGAGWWERERALLGPALLQGGTDARQILGLRALSRGDRETASHLFGALLVRPPAAGEGPEVPARELPPWALRGWGVALLPPSNDPLISRSAAGPPSTPDR